MSRIGKSIVVCLLTAVLLVSMVGVASATMYYLDSDKDTGGSEQYIMWKDSSGECSGSVDIGADNSEIWTANEAASGDVDFSGGKNWAGNIKCANDGKKYTAYIGYYDGTNFHSYGDSGEITISGGHGDFGITSSAFTVPTGKWLALKVASSTGIIVSTTIGGLYNSGVYFDTPPDYPVPELPTIILMSIGLLALLGYVGYRRRDNG